MNNRGGGGSGGGGAGGTVYVPTTHTLWSNQAGQIQAGSGWPGGPFTLTMAGSVDYMITNRSTTSPDHWDVGVMPQGEKQFFDAGQPWNAYGPQSDVSTFSDSVGVPAGTYYFVVRCDNAIEDCQFSIDATMTF